MLTSRERVVIALEHHEPDRVPVDLNPNYEPYANLKEYLGLEIDENLKTSNMGEVIPHPKVLNALGVDIISVKLGSPKNAKITPPQGDLVFDEWGVGYRRYSTMGGSNYMEAVYHPLANATLEDLEKYPWPDPSLPGRGEGAEITAKRLYEDTDLALLGRFGGPILEVAIYMLGFENWLVCTASRPDFAEALLSRITSYVMELDRIGLQAAGRYIQIFKVSGDDLGMQTGLLYSPRIFHKVLMPHLSRRWNAARVALDEINPSAKIMYHSCGSIYPLIPDMIENGIQVLDPVQPTAANMNSAKLKAEFGDRLSFHGGIDEQKVLPFGSPDDVRNEVRERIHDFAPGGGYILTSSHYVQADTPPKNIVAMCQATHELGTYPIQC
jgi:uroporphyrinogen decarboxylase